MRRLPAASLSAAVFAAVSALAADPPALPPGSPAKVIANDVPALQKALNNGKPTRTVTPQLKGYPLMIAWQAQQAMTGPDAAKMAGLRDHAVRVAEAVAKKDYATADKLADGLKDAKPGDPKAAVTLTDKAKVQLGDVMATFRGLNVKAANPRDAEVIAARAVGVAAFARALPADKSPKWAMLVNEMEAAAKELAAEAAKPSPGNLSGLLRALDTSCANCHAVYRR